MKKRCDICLSIPVNYFNYEFEGKALKTTPYTVKFYTMLNKCVNCGHQTVSFDLTRAEADRLIAEILLSDVVPSLVLKEDLLLIANKASPMVKHSLLQLINVIKEFEDDPEE